MPWCIHGTNNRYGLGRLIHSAIGWLWWQEPTGPTTLVGTACVVAAGVWVSRAPLKG